MNVGQKADHVRAAAARGHDGKHGCHWPGCDKRVPPAMWGCKRHWFALPLELRRRIWATYRPGQEDTKTPSRAYVEAAKDVREWIEQHSQNWPAPKAPTPPDPQGTLL